MDALDRTFRHLVQTIQARFPANLTRPFEVAELYQNILPYRHHRRELGIDTNQDYEQVLLQLLSGARDYIVVDDHMRETLARELASPNPDPGAFREFSSTQISLSADAVRRVLDGAFGSNDGIATPATAGRPAASSATEVPRASEGNRPTVVPTSGTSRSLSGSSSTPRGSGTASSTGTVAPAPRVTGIVVQPGEQCRYCGGALPTGRRVTFCPHCGQNLTIVKCLACGTELELGWKFCTTCGRPASAT
jgi:hypothetical protein